MLATRRSITRMGPRSLGLVGFGAAVVALGGCPWVSPAEHRANRDRLVPPDPEPVHSDTVEHSGPVACVEDADEPNDRLADAVAVVLPASFPGAMCSSSPDHWSVSVDDPSLVLGAMVSCDGDVVVRMYHDGYRYSTVSGPCPLDAQLGMGVGEYVVGITPSGGEPSYELALEGVPCSLDRDGDGQPSAVCLGADCNDDDDTVWRGAPELPGNAIDEDCDGADDLGTTIASCTPAIGDTVPSVPPLACGATDLDPVWHHYTFDTVLYATVDVFLTPVSGPADLFAYYTDDAGVYGLEPGEPALDSEDRCAVAGFGQCPSTCIATPIVGPAHLWVAQRDCTGPVDYELRLSAGGPVPVTLEVDVPGPAAAR